MDTNVGCGHSCNMEHIICGHTDIASKYRCNMEHIDITCGHRNISCEYTGITCDYATLSCEHTNITRERTDTECRNTDITQSLCANIIHFLQHKCIKTGITSQFDK